MTCLIDRVLDRAGMKSHVGDFFCIYLGTMYADFQEKIFVEISWKKFQVVRVSLFNIPTHGCRNVTISALAYLINYLDCQRSGRVMGGPTFFKVGDLFYKICPSHYANFRKKSHLKRPVECLKLWVLHKKLFFM